jgi:hypothetical protein
MPGTKNQKQSPGDDEKEETTDYADYTNFLFFLRVSSCNFVTNFLGIFIVGEILHLKYSKNWCII